VVCVNQPEVLAAITISTVAMAGQLKGNTRKYAGGGNVNSLREMWRGMISGLYL
jgi:hypothetical protein